MSAVFRENSVDNERAKCKDNIMMRLLNSDAGHKTWQSKAQDTVRPAYMSRIVILVKDTLLPCMINGIARGIARNTAVCRVANYPIGLSRSERNL